MLGCARRRVLILPLPEQCDNGTHAAKGRRVPQVLITCPITKSLIPTGIHVTNLEDVDDDNLLIACPECGRDHEWTRNDAVLAAG